MSGNGENKSAPERRNRKRVNADKLPPEMKEFRLDFGEGQVYTATTIDVSLTSISFLVEVPANRIREYNVTLSSKNEEIKMTQELVYIKPVDPQHSRISFMYSSDSTPALYRRLVSKALKS